MAIKEKAPVEPKEPAYILIEKYGLAFKKGWLWLIYPIGFLLISWHLDFGTASISSVVGGLMEKAASYVFKAK